MSEVIRFFKSVKRDGFKKASKRAIEGIFSIKHKNTKTRYIDTAAKTRAERNLCYAVKNNNIKKVKELIERGCDINFNFRLSKDDIYKQSPLQYVLKWQDIIMTKLIHQKKELKKLKKLKMLEKNQPKKLIKVFLPIKDKVQ